MQCHDMILWYNSWIPLVILWVKQIWIRLLFPTGYCRSSAESAATNKQGHQMEAVHARCKQIQLANNKVRTNKLGSDTNLQCHRTRDEYLLTYLLTVVIWCIFREISSRGLRYSVNCPSRTVLKIVMNNEKFGIFTSGIRSLREVFCLSKLGGWGGFPNCTGNNSHGSCLTKPILYIDFWNFDFKFYHYLHYDWHCNLTRHLLCCCRHCTQEAA